MTPERWREVDQMLEAALDLLPHRRAAFLDQACAGNAELRQEIETLLQAHDQATGFIEKPPATEMGELFDLGAQDDFSGRRIGPYLLARELGRGGMGVVYLAARDDDEFRKQVAIKLVGSGPQNAALMRRFRRERQILASLDHPNIARLLDGGRTEQGWPYLVMEYVEGVPIHKYCNQHRLSISARLKLFREVCQAVQYAHQNLVIHRDLKPSNILVTADGTVKLLDFGIAKLLHTQSGAITQTFTTQLATGALMMTPEYASPEQVRGAPVTTASDVYSLGVVLYELLAGQPPYRFNDRSLTELVRVVCEEEPEPPSAAVMHNAQLGQQFNEARLKLRAQLRGDPDQIVQTALQKDVQLRYRSAEQLSEDLRRHLEGKPILARQASWRYRTGKFVRRYKVGVALVALLLLSLLGGIVATTWQWLAVQRLGRIAEAQLATNRRLAYAGQMTLATQAWETANVERMRQLVESYLMQDGEEDLRGFEWYYLWRLYHHTGERFSLKHPQEVWAVAFAPDGKRFATGGNDGKARLWNAASGELVTELAGHQEYIWSVAFSPDGRMLATGSGDTTAKIWEVATGRELATFRGHSKRVGTISFSPDGKKLATGSRDGTVRLWEIATGRELVMIKTSAAPVESIALSPDGKTLAIGRAAAPILKLHDVETGREIATNFTTDISIWSVTFSPEGKTIASGHSSAVIKLWEAATGREVSTLAGHTGEIRSVAFSPNGQKLATASSDRTVKLWSVPTGKDIATLKGHLSENFSLAFSPDGRELLSGSADRTARLWDLVTASEPQAFFAGPSKQNTIAVSFDGKKLVTKTSPARAPMVWDAETFRELMALEKGELAYLGIALSPDGKKIATAGPDQTARLWDAATGHELTVFKGHQGTVYDVTFSPDGRWLATGGGDNTVRLWDLNTGRELMTFNGHTKRCVTLRFSPDGRRLASGSYDQTARLWDAATGRELFTLASHANPVLTLAFSPDGQLLATGSADSLVKFWQVSTGRELGGITGHAGHVTTLAFSPDGKRLVTGGSEGLVRLWDVETRQEWVTLRGHNNVINSVAFSADGRALFSIGGDGFVRVWRAANEQEVTARGRR